MALARGGAWARTGPAVAVVHAAAISTAATAAPPASPVRTRWPIGIARIVALA